MLDFFVNKYLKSSSFYNDRLTFIRNKNRCKNISATFVSRVTSALQYIIWFRRVFFGFSA